MQCVHVCACVCFQMPQDPYSYLCHCLSPVAVLQDSKPRSQSPRSKFIRAHCPTSVYVLVGTKPQQSSSSPASAELRPCYLSWGFVLNLATGYVFSQRTLFTWICKIISCRCVLSLSPHWFPKTVLVDSPFKAAGSQILQVVFRKKAENSLLTYSENQQCQSSAYRWMPCKVGLLGHF